MCMLNLQLPDGAAFHRSKDVMAEIEQEISSIPGVENTLAVNGYSIVDNAVSSNTSFCVVTFEPWDERKKAGLHQDDILLAINQKMSALRDGVAFAFPMPSLPWHWCFRWPQLYAPR